MDIYTQTVSNIPMMISFTSKFTITYPPNSPVFYQQNRPQHTAHWLFSVIPPSSKPKVLGWLVGSWVRLAGEARAGASQGSFLHPDGFCVFFFCFWFVFAAPFNNKKGGEEVNYSASWCFFLMLLFCFWVVFLEAILQKFSISIDKIIWINNAPPKIKSSPLKNDAWKPILSFWEFASFQGRTVEPNLKAFFVSGVLWQPFSHVFCQSSVSHMHIHNWKLTHGS